MIFSNENAKIGGDRMTSDFMKELLSKDEKITVEYKNCQYGIQEDVYETVCSFSNRYGGYIIMGVEDDGTPIGINPNMVKDMKKNFVNQLNNPDKMSPTGSMTEMKMGIWILRTLRFSYRICITEKATHMRSTRYSHMLQRKIYAWI